MHIKHLLLLLLISNSLFAQRTIPNPIILVHGFTADHTTWTDFLKYLETNLKLKIEPNTLAYNLNCDGNNATSILQNDVCEYSSPIGNYDVYVINFGVNKYSSQAAAVKQGYAIRLAVARILAATGADRVTMLGHSMGGLAIREYVQNQSNYQQDGLHHVARMATIGTPHGGSDLGTQALNFGGIFGKDEYSEAARDLKTNTITGKKGVYLFGGSETAANLGNIYYNNDVNCNGIIGNNIVGLNQKGFPSNIDVSCVVGGISSDLVVTTYSQNMNNFYGIWAKVFNYQCTYLSSCHSEEPRKAFTQMVQALDEPDKIPTTLKEGLSSQGFFANELQDVPIDYDEYYMPINQTGIVTLYFTGNTVNKIFININDIESNNVLVNHQGGGSNVSLTFVAKKTGNYRVLLRAETPNVIANYYLKYTLCPTADLSIAVEGKTTLCENESTTLKISNNVFEEYTWYVDSKKIASNTPTIIPKQSGLYYVTATKCGQIQTSQPIAIKITPTPPKPTITLQDIGFVSSSPTGNQWYKDGTLLKDSTNQVLKAYGSGVFMVRVNNNGCYGPDSDAFTITPIEPMADLFVKLYPNPNEGTFWVELPESLKSWQVDVFDVLGKGIFSKLHKNSTSNKEQIIIKAIGGSYILRVMTTNSSQSIKFIID